MNPVWHFPHVRNGAPTLSGDMAKNFLNEVPESMDGEYFSRDEDQLSKTAKFFAREFTQNAVDANADPDFQRIFSNLQLHLHFKFVALTGEEKRRFVISVGFDDLADRLSGIAEHAARDRDSALLHLKDDSPLILLYANELGASGMYGPWDDSLGISKMTFALLSHNVSEKPSDAGGGFGKGKSVNALASKARVNIAYTKFHESFQPSDGATRRMLGVAYWPKHNDKDGRACQGIGFFHNPVSSGLDGGHENDAANPWADSDADRMAELLGFDKREGADAASFGSSLLIVDPDFTAEELREAMQRYWWPAIERGSLLVSITDHEGGNVEVRPRRDPRLRPFIRCFEALQTNSETSEIRIYPADRHTKLEVSSGNTALTQRALEADATTQKSVVAMMRRLGMVVQYRDVKVTSPAVQGVFEANPESSMIQSLLKKSEPAAHDRWIASNEEADPETKENIRTLVSGIHGSITKACRKLSDELAPDLAQNINQIDALNKLFSAFLNPGTGPLPESPARDFSIRRLPPKLEAISADQVVASGTVEFRQLAADSDSARVAIRYYLPDDNNKRHQPIPLQLVPDGGEHSELSGEGGSVDVLFRTSGENSRFKVHWRTVPYSKLFVGDLDVAVLVPELEQGEQDGA